MMETVTLILVFLVPAVLLLLGLLWRVRPPEMHSTSPLAYRTALSTSSRDAWDAAHRQCSGLWIRMGLILLVLLGAMVALVDRETYESFLIWLFIGEMVLFCCTAFLVDMTLKAKFDGEEPKQ